MNANDLGDRQSIGKFLEIERHSPSYAKAHWHIYNKKHDEFLGDIQWCGSWRQYVFAPVRCTDFSAGCLDDIAKAIRGCGKEVCDE